MNNLNSSISPLLNHITEGRFANASRLASELQRNAADWASSLAAARDRADKTRDQALESHPTTSPDTDPNAWNAYQHRVKDAQAQWEATAELQSAMTALAHALRRVAEETGNRACDRETSPTT